MFSKPDQIDIVDINVGGTRYTVSRLTLLKDPHSRLHGWFNAEGQVDGLQKDAQGSYFIDRDGFLFRFVLDYLRNDGILLPDGFSERKRLLHEAHYFNLQGLVQWLTSTSVTQYSNKVQRLSSANTSGHITIGYQGSFSFGRQGLAADVNFRKINRILVCGKVSLCREVFGESLNEGRDPDRGHQIDRDRYTSRYYLKHNLLERAFDMLADAGFHLVSSCASGTSGATPDAKTGSNTEEDRWAHYNEFVFYRNGL